MALGKRRREPQLQAVVMASDLPRSAGHPFYVALNKLLAEQGFDQIAEEACAPFYADAVSRPSIPPGRPIVSA
jgi:hypothetical protein